MLGKDVRKDLLAVLQSACFVGALAACLATSFVGGAVAVAGAAEAAETQEGANEDDVRSRAETLRERARGIDGGADLAAFRSEIADLAEQLLQDVEAADRPKMLVHLHHTHEIARRNTTRLALPSAQRGITGDSQTASNSSAEALSRIDAVLAKGLHEAADAARAQGDTALFAHATLERALLAERHQNRGEALRLVREAAPRAASGPHLRTLYRAHWLLARLHQAMNSDQAALRSYRSAVSVLEEMKASLVARSANDAFSFRDEVAPIYAGLADLLLQRAAEVPRNEQALLAEARLTIEASRQAELRDHFEDACLTQIEEASPDSIPGTVVVYPVALPDRLALIVSREGRLSQHVSPIEIERYAELTDTLRTHLENRMTRRYRRPAADLYDALIRPIESRLMEGPVETLVFIPDRALRKIPLAALRNRDSGEFLIEEYALAIAPSLELTSPRKIDTQNAQLLAGALSQAVQGFPALSFVVDEIDAASQAFPSEVLVDETFRTAPLTNALAQVPFDILHIASHAEFNGEADESFILTWDGKMSLNELSAAIGRARFRTERPLEMIVLSACETAVGDDRAALGLAGAALQMGARSVLASLWSVNDEASSKLMARYYTALGDSTKTRAEALREAQRSLLQEKPYAHPSAWAPFILIGSWL